jgi:hypothetical protein
MVVAVQARPIALTQLVLAVLVVAVWVMVALERLTLVAVAQAVSMLQMAAQAVAVS